MAYMFQFGRTDVFLATLLPTSSLKWKIIAIFTDVFCVKPVALCCPAHRLLSSHLPPVRHADFEGQWIEMGCVTKCG